jgi:hypothetical protein
MMNIQDMATETIPIMLNLRREGGAGIDAEEILIVRSCDIVNTVWELYFSDDYGCLVSLEGELVSLMRLKEFQQVPVQPGKRIC